MLFHQLTDTTRNSSASRTCNSHDAPLAFRKVTLRRLVLLSASLLLIGCGLSKDQLAATQSFAKASKSYP
jgi:hypothetical protein